MGKARVSPAHPHKAAKYNGSGGASQIYSSASATPTIALSSPTSQKRWTT